MIALNLVRSRQDGAALVVALVMLALVTLLAAVSSTAVQTNLKVVQNIESRAMAVNAALSGLEQVLAEAVAEDITAFDGAVLYYDASGDQVAGTELRVQTALACVTLRPVEGLQVWDPSIPASAPADGCIKECDPITGVCTSTDCADVLWEVDVEALDELTGARATIRQGLEERSDVNATTSC